MHSTDRKRFIFSTLEMRLDYDFSPALIHETLKKQPLPDLLNMLTSCSAEAIQRLKALKYEMPGGAFKAICQYNYSDLFRMRDRLQVMQQSEIFAAMNEAALIFYENLDTAIGIVIKHLESLGIRALAPAELLPDHFRESRQEILRQQANIFQAKCKSKSVDGELSGLLMNFFQSSCVRENFTQKELHYSEQLMTALLNFLNKQREGECDLPLMYKLLRINYNCPDFYRYFSKRIIDKLEEFDGTKRKLMALNFHCKELKQMLPFPDMAMNPDAPELRTLLLDYMQEEICYLEKELEDDDRLNKQKPVIEPSPGPQAIQTPDLDKLALNGNMRELALVVRLMHRKTIPLSPGGIKASLKFFSRHFRTLSGEQLSVDSLSKRYSEVNTATCISVLGSLEDMVRILKEEIMK